ncbi:MAG: Intein-containing protein [Parcubacteria group bacterium GW2011_GWA2_49_9]|nr:MAG: Intein-containing protein [Parcubacteria group bacterium GW2011_GWA2_49_9]
MAGMRKYIDTNWSPHLAYVVGIIATDGSIGQKRAYINITSKDRELLEDCRAALNVQNKIGRKARGGSTEKKYFVLQLINITLYTFLLKVGIVPAKSKILGKLLVPDKFFSDFLRGCIDGDGSIGSFTHPESRLPQFRIRLYSASLDFLVWIKKRVETTAKIKGGWICSAGKGLHALTFGKRDSVQLAEFLYPKGTTLFLKRKYDRVKQFWASGEIG